MGGLGDNANFAHKETGECAGLEREVFDGGANLFWDSEYRGEYGDVVFVYGWDWRIKLFIDGFSIGIYE